MTGRDRSGWRRGLVAVAVMMVLAAIAPTAAAQDGSPGEVRQPFTGAEAPPRVPADPTEEPVLAEPSSGQEALDGVGDRLDEVAARNGMSPEHLEQLLLTDPTLHLDRHGMAFYVDPAPDPSELAPSEPAPAAPFPYSETFLLHSKPGSNRTIYLDFNGHTLPASNGWTGEATTTLAYNTVGLPGTFTNAEKDAIQSIWQRVAEDFAPFDVDVTTEFPGVDRITRGSGSDQIYGTRAVITSSDPGPFCGFCGGVAYVGVFNLTAFHAFYQPAWCFDTMLAGGDPKSVAECVSHEVGHNLNLDHDGREFFGEYYEGHDPWAPIMGVGYYQPVTQWSKGDYDGATNTQDDLTVMSNYGVKERADDHTNADSTATVLIGSRAGIVTSSADYDRFSFTASASGEVTFVAEPATVSPNLDVVLRLFAAGSVLLETASPPVVKVTEDAATGMDASITYDVDEGVTYYLQVNGGAYLDPTTGYPRYGSIGDYTVRAEGMVGLSSCGGLVATIQGTNAAETITGTSGVDVIDGLGGDDVIDGLGGDDVLCGSEGDDTIIGGGGADDLFGGGGSDHLDGLIGNDLLRGGSGADTLLGGVGGDDLWGDTGGDDLDGGKGNDSLHGGEGADAVEGGGGNDDVDGGIGADDLGGGIGLDHLTGGAGNDELNGGGSGDELHGGDGADVVDGNAGADDLWGEAGADTLNGGDGADTLKGGTGSDVCRGAGGIDTATTCEVKTGIP